MAFNWFFTFGKGTRPVFVRRSKPVPQVIQLLPLQLEGEEIKKGNENSKRQLDELSKQVKKLGSRQDEMAMAVEELTESLEDQMKTASSLLTRKEKEINALKKNIDSRLPLNQKIIPSSLNKKAALYGAVKIGLDRVEELITEIW